MRRISVLFALLLACTCAYGQYSIQFSSPDPGDILRQHRAQMDRIHRQMDEQFRRMMIQSLPASALSVRARCEPAEPVVGERCDLILELDIDRRVGFENPPQVSGMPEGGDVQVTYGPLENLEDKPSSTAGRVVKRLRCPMRFWAPVSLEVPSLRIRGEVADRTGQLYAFNRQFAPVRLEVRPPPEKDRPANFTGAVGRKFLLKQSLNRDHVRLNKEFVTVAYTLAFSDGYCPKNVFPDVGRFSKDFKVYPPKEAERKEDARSGMTRVTWKQDLIPLTAQATNTASVSFTYYNTQTKRYEVAHADPLPIAFVSAEAESSENTRVAVTGLATTQEASVGKGADVTTEALVLHFAPSEDSPIVVTIDAGTPVKELATWNGWRRLEAPNAIGWTRSN